MRGVQAVAISHYNIIVAVVQLATSQGVNDHRLDRDQARFRVGDVSTGGTFGRVVSIYYANSI